MLSNKRALALGVGALASALVLSACSSGDSGKSAGP